MFFAQVYRNNNTIIHCTFIRHYLILSDHEHGASALLRVSVNSQPSLVLILPTRKEWPGCIDLCGRCFTHLQIVKQQR